MPRPLPLHEAPLLDGLRFTDQEISNLGYKSWPDSLDCKQKALDAVVALLKEHAGDNWKNLFLQVPGFYMRELKSNAEPVVMAEFRAALEEGNEEEIVKAEQRVRENDKIEGKVVGEVPEIGGMPGTLLPLRDERGRIVRLQIRLADPPADKNKYRAFSTPVYDGAGAGMQPHHPLCGGHIESRRVRAVEGVFKADIATLKTGDLCVAYASASAWRQVIPTLKKVGAKAVVLPFDADVATNSSVAGSMARFACKLRENGYEVEVETWDPKFGKGIDDVLSAGHGKRIEVLRGKRVWRHLQTCLTSSGANKNPDVLVNMVLSDLVDRAKKDPSYLFNDNVLVGAAFIGDGPRYRKLLDQLKEAKVAVTDFKKAVASKRTELKRKDKEQKALAQGQRLFQRGDHTEIAIAVLDKLAEKDSKGKIRHESLVWDEGVLHVYKMCDGIWRGVTAKEESLIVQGFAGSPKGTKSILNVNLSDVRGAVTLAHQRVHHPSYFAEAPMGFAFDNGFVEVRESGLHLRQHQLDDRVRFKFDFDFRPHSADRWIQFLGQVFLYDTDAEERIAFLQEFFGACLLGIAPTYFGKIVIFHGDGENGKSKLAEIIEKCFPPEAVCSITPHNWRNDYHVVQLAGKRFNLCGELPARELTDSEIVKLVVTAEHKVRGRSPYMEPVEFFSVAGHLFLANIMPGTTDQSHGFWRRFVVIPFTRTFYGDEADKLIVEKVLKDRMGIVVWMLEGAQRVLARGGLDKIPSSCEAAKREWQLDADPVRRFMEKVVAITTVTNEMESLEMLFCTFDPWAKGKNHRPMAESTFGNRVKQVMKDWARTRPEMFTGLTDKQRHQLLTEGHIHTSKGNRYPVRLPATHDISCDDLDNLFELDEARKAAAK